jgi:hypothetical protein
MKTFNKSILGALCLSAAMVSMNTLAQTQKTGTATPAFVLGDTTELVIEEVVTAGQKGGAATTKSNAFAFKNLAPRYPGPVRVCMVSRPGESGATHQKILSAMGSAMVKEIKDKNNKPSYGIVVEPAYQTKEEKIASKVCVSLK